MDKALQHAPGIVAALVGIGITARAQRLELQPGGLPRHGHALQALPLVQQLMGKDACDLRMRQAQRLARIGLHEKGARHEDAPAIHGQRPARVAQAAQIKAHARQQRIQRGAEVRAHKGLFLRIERPAPEHHAQSPGPCR
ncbi:putative phosphoserine aminotransferase (ISS) protein [Corchorus olitorius]|uniref:Phosphoserine aminotransferase (ISS) protein n=1 Tax=Corchorus olitorius TaxID=93759 RepID=A0A1R3L0T8_9ROSI|nr:putative phosphoserine aminotransferase (ISS) protein [Corchorus olitorius]